MPDYRNKSQKTEENKIQGTCAFHFCIHVRLMLQILYNVHCSLEHSWETDKCDSPLCGMKSAVGHRFERLSGYLMLHGKGLDPPNCCLQQYLTSRSHF